MNLECAVTEEMIANALRIKPHDLCWCRNAARTDHQSGLDVVRYFDAVKRSERCAAAGIRVSLFMTPTRNT
jgi:pyridoxine 5-phosphate synthase